MPIFCDKCEAVVPENDLTRIDGNDYCGTCSQEPYLGSDRTQNSQDISPKIDIRSGCIYIELNGWTYYIDDSTGEQIFEKWNDASTNAWNANTPIKKTGD